MDRRSFLRLAGGLTGTGLVATATMAEAGWLAEVLDWLRRRPATFVPKYYSHTISLDGFTEALNDGFTDATWDGSIFPLYGSMMPKFWIEPGTMSGIVEDIQHRMDEAVEQLDIQIRRDMMSHGIRT